VQGRAVLLFVVRLGAHRAASVAGSLGSAAAPSHGPFLSGVVVQGVDLSCGEGGGQCAHLADGGAGVLVEGAGVDAAARQDFVIQFTAQAGLWNTVDGVGVQVRPAMTPNNPNRFTIPGGTAMESFECTVTRLG
jgi:hypothetical protein